MAVERTGAIYKSLFFDGEDSRDYGVYITGEAVFNAPEREVEMISIPGRNGQLALDKGRFENIEVTYPAGIFADTEADFAEAISDFRNLLCSRRGYVRLQDDYHPDEYRMAVYKSGLEVTPAQLRAGEFNIVFDCKPQRYLTSGETAISVDSGDTVTNPTLFDASPLLEIKGAGSIYINGETVSVNGGTVGWVTASNAIRNYGSYTASNAFSTQYANIGDEITTHGEIYIYVEWSEEGINWYDYSVVGDGDGGFDQGGAYVAIFRAYIPTSVKYYYGTPATHSVEVTFRTWDGQGQEINLVLEIALAYDGNDEFTATAQATLPTGFTRRNQYTEIDKVRINSTQSVLGNPLYFDLDMGEAYKIEGGIPVSVNSGVTMPNDLPKLTSGANTITFDNTITDLKVIPRWWKV